MKDCPEKIKVSCVKKTYSFFGVVSIYISPFPYQPHSKVPDKTGIMLEIPFPEPARLAGQAKNPTLIPPHTINQGQITKG